MIDHFEVVVRENEKVIEYKARPDPFIQTTLVPRGLKAAWMVLRGKLVLTVNVFGTKEAEKAISVIRDPSLVEEPKTVFLQ